MGKAGSKSSARNFFKRATYWAYSKSTRSGGYEVLAIDASQTALDLVQERFKKSTIRFEK